MKNKKTKHRLHLILTGIFAVLSAIALFALAVLQSDSIKTRAKQYVLDYLHKNNLPVEIGAIEGVFPFYWNLTDVVITAENETVAIDRISLRISFLALAKKEVALRRCLVQNVVLQKTKKTAYRGKAKKTAAAEKTAFSAPFFDVSIRHFKIENFHLGEENFDLSGHAFLERKARSFNLATTVYSNNFKEDILRFKVKGSEKTQKGYATLLLKKGGFYFISPKLKERLERQTGLALFFKSSFADLKTLLFQQRLASDLNGFLKGTVAAEGLVSKIRGNIVVKSDLSSALKNFYIKNNLFSAKGEFNLSSSFALDSMQFSLSSKNLSLLEKLYGFPVKGFLNATLKTKQEKALLELSTKDLVLGRHPVKNLKGQIKGSLEDALFSGQASLRFLALEDNVILNSRFYCGTSRENRYLKLEKCKIAGTSFHLYSPKFIFLANRLTEGRVQLTFSSIASLERLFPQLILKSAGELKLAFSPVDTRQDLQIEGFLKDYHFNSLLGSRMAFSADLKDVFRTPVGSIRANGARLSFYDLFFDSFEGMSHSLEKNSWDFSFFAKGNWRKPVKCYLSGAYFYQPQDQQHNLKIINFSGEALKSSFHLQKRSLISWKDRDHFSVSDFKFSMGRSYLNADVSVSGRNNEINIAASHFPLDFLSFNPLKLKTTGFASCNFSLKQSPFNISSDLQLSLEDSTLASLSDEHPLQLQGDISSKIENGLLSGTCDLKSGKTGLLSLTLSVPLKIGRGLFYFDLREQKNLKAKLAYEGRAEDILDFFNLHNNRLEGDMFCQLALSKNLINPRLEGFVKLENGIFENYQSGSYFQNISANFNFEKSRLVIEKLHAYDTGKNLVSAEGYLSFNKLLNYPYSVKCSFDSAKIVKSNFIEANANGGIEIKGNAKKALIKGKAAISYGLICIPEDIPLVIPAIPTKYINTEEITAVKKKSPPYPIALDLELVIPKNVFVKGRGVDAELQGGVYLTGSLDDIVSSGRLNVLKGRYEFSGKTFELIDSSVIFPGIKGSFPELAITGQIEQKGIVINANLKGPLNAPRLYFTSSPSLPLGSIISLLLFGRDISGISAIQALQVANAISSLSEDNNILESAKKKLGIDRLTVISTSSEESEDPDQVAILIGKYITKNVLLAFSRGFDYGVSNIIVEVDLIKGIMFQFETMAQEQQNKYTLKWKHNY